MHLAQCIELLDSRQQAPWPAVRFRIGVTSARDSATVRHAVARRSRCSTRIVANPIGADPAQVFLRILCVNRAAGDLCALGGALENGLNIVLKTIDLPSLADDDPTTPDVTLAPRCLQPLGDGTLGRPSGSGCPASRCSPGQAWRSTSVPRPVVAEPVTGAGAGPSETVVPGGLCRHLGRHDCRPTTATVSKRTAVGR